MKYDRCSHFSPENFWPDIRTNLRPYQSGSTTLGIENTKNTGNLRPRPTIYGHRKFLEGTPEISDHRETGRNTKTKTAII
jgi:hypothetical protein